MSSLRNLSLWGSTSVFSSNGLFSLDDYSRSSCQTQDEGYGGAWGDILRPSISYFVQKKVLNTVIPYLWSLGQS